MTRNHFAILILLATSLLSSIDAWSNTKPAIKEFTTPPPTEEALPVNSIPPLYSASSSNTTPASPASTQQSTPTQQPKS